MPISSKNQDSFNAALKRVSEEANVLKRTYKGLEFEFSFLPSMSMPAMEVVGKLQELGESSSPIPVFKTVREFMKLLAVSDTCDDVVFLLDEAIMSPQDLIELQQAVVQGVAARPTVRSSSSDSGSSPDGPTSTASALTETSTPQPSL